LVYICSEKVGAGVIKSMSSAPLKPFLKWAGGKSQLVEILAAHVPQSYGKYIEPFVGGGALFFYLRPQNAILSDSNPELINCYRVVRDHVGDLISLLATYPHDKTFTTNDQMDAGIPGNRQKHQTNLGWQQRLTCLISNT
jgi:site-specific DNA-adenine methylase